MHESVDASAGNGLGSGPVRLERLQGEHALLDGGQGPAADIEEDELSSLGRLRWAFDAWREYSVRKATGHTGLLRQGTKPGEHCWPVQRLWLIKVWGVDDHLCTREDSGIFLGMWWSRHAFEE